MAVAQRGLVGAPRDAAPGRERRDVFEPRGTQHATGKSLSQQLSWQPERIGPRFDWLGHDRIRVRDGRLAGAELGIITQVNSGSASCSLHLAGRGVGKVIVEREQGRGVTLWDLGVAPSQRGTGLASILTWVILRELLAVQENAEFRIRMVRTLRVPGHDPKFGEARELRRTQHGHVTACSSGVQNIGMCVIANRLGFTSDLDVEAALLPGNVVRRSVLEAGNGMPPALEVVLQTDPLVLVFLVLDPASSLPVRDRNVYVRMMDDETMLLDWLRAGSVVVTNGNLSLRAAGVNRFINRVAVDEEEVVRFRKVVRGL